MNYHSPYCKNCDKWLDNPKDYEKRRIGRWDDNGGTWEYKCKSCGKKTFDEHQPVRTDFACGWCCKMLSNVDEETWNKGKPNWRKRIRMGHIYGSEDNDYKTTIRHDCRKKCSACNKEYQITQEYVNNGEYVYQWFCISCSIENLKKQNAEDSSDSQFHQRVRILKSLEKMIGNKRERERERRFWLTLPSTISNLSLSKAIS